MCYEYVVDIPEVTCYSWAAENVNTLPVGDLVTEFLTDRQRIGYNIPQAVLHSLMLLKMGKTVARNMSS